MAPMRTSNVERQRWRNTCREKLSDYIESKLGIRVEPSHVRLVTGPDELYQWKAIPEKQYLFAKNLSDHSTGAYRELCDGVDKTFEVIALQNTTTLQPNTACMITTLQPPIDLSFTSRIEKLREENERYCGEIDSQKNLLGAEKRRRGELEVEIEEIRRAHQRLQEQLETSTSLVRSLKDSLTVQSKGLEKVLPVLQHLRKTIPAQA